MDFMNKDFTGYEVTGHKFEIYGRCPKCVSKSSSVKLTSFYRKEGCSQILWQPSFIVLVSLFLFLAQRPFQQRITSISFSVLLPLFLLVLYERLALYGIIIPPRAPAIPISASRASPGPFTAQPSTATLIGT